LVSIGLDERCHQVKRGERRKMARRILALLTQAIKYESCNPSDVHIQVLGTARDIIEMLEKFPPLVMEKGIISIREWLTEQGINLELISPPATRLTL